MKAVTLERFKEFDPCWLKTKEGRNCLEEIGSRKAEWTALDVLNLEEVNPFDRLWAVLRKDFISSKTLYNFALFCYKRALKMEVDQGNCNWNAIAVDLDSAFYAAKASSIRSCLEIKLASARISYRFSVKDLKLDVDGYTTIDAERKRQIEELKKMLLEENESEENENY